MPVSVWTSTLQRTIQTAEQLPFPKLRWKARQKFVPNLYVSLQIDALALKCVSKADRFPARSLSTPTSTIHSVVPDHKICWDDYVLLGICAGTG